MFMATHLLGDSVWTRPMSMVLKLEQTLVKWLARDYQRRSLRIAVTVAYASFGREYPQWVASLFDDYFVFHHLLPMLIIAGETGVPVTTEQVAEQYADQVSGSPASRERFCAEVMPAADYFLHLVAAALEEASMTTLTIGIQFASRDLPVLG